jgi:putative nucleotidyltransferase with HDIG domain
VNHESRRSRIVELLPEIAWIERSDWREAVIDIWLEVWSESAWADPADCPKSHKQVLDSSNVLHTRSVTLQALATADVVERLHGERIDRDVLIVAALLHDVSKLVECEPGDVQPRTSRVGALLQHGTYAAHKALAHGLPPEIAHVLISHTHQSRTLPATPEAIIIHYVDFLDSDILLLQRGIRLFAKS